MDSEAIVCVNDFERRASRRLSPYAWGYYHSGSDQETSLRDNIEAFKRWRIIPRVLQDVVYRDLSTSMLGYAISFPVCVAPCALQGLAHPLAEISAAKGVAKIGTIFTLSTMSSKSIEDVAGAVDSLKFFHTYIFHDREVTRDLIERAERSGYKAIVLTVDAPVVGKKYADARNQFTPHGHGNLSKYSKTSVSLFDASFSWKDIPWIMSITKLPVILKGILSVEDAKLAVQCEVSGIIISNHGGRQLDTVPATIDVLAEIVQVVGGRCEVYLDGGIRLGTDVFKALALGAKAVFVARPVLYALAFNGSEGVAQMLQILKDELHTAMALAGCQKISDIQKSFITHQKSLVQYSKI